MSNAALILELLDEIKPNRYCDDCLSRDLSIQPRQQVNQICRRLEGQGKIVREMGVCDSCKKYKTTSFIYATATSLPTMETIVSRKTYTSDIAAPKSEVEPDIEKLRTQVVHICHQIWSDLKPETPPHSISVVINTLKNDDLLPSHQANMMLTLCNLRNAYVYESIELGIRETTIASNAWDIIHDWWIKYKK